MRRSRPNPGSSGGSDDGGVITGKVKGIDPNGTIKMEVENQAVVLRTYPSELPKDVLESVLNKLARVEGVTTDDLRRTVSLKYTARKWSKLKNLETVSNRAKMPARILSPARVIFKIRSKTGARPKEFREQVAKLRFSNLKFKDGKLDIRVDVRRTAWSAMFRLAREHNVTLDPTTHRFYRLRIERGDATTTTSDKTVLEALQAMPGVLIAGSDKEQIGVVSTKEIRRRHLEKLLDGLGLKATIGREGKVD